MSQPHPLALQLDPADPESPYALFCLNSRIQPAIKKAFGTGSALNMVDSFEGYYLVKLVHAGEEQMLTPQMRTELGKLLQEFWGSLPGEERVRCVLLHLEDVKSLGFPRSWALDFLSRVSLPEGLSPRKSHSVISILLSPYEDYTKRHADLLRSLLSNMRESYSRGYVFGREYEGLASSWSLRDLSGKSPLPSRARVRSPQSSSQQPTRTLLRGRGERREEAKGGVEGAFVPEWEDERFAPDRVLFLRERALGVRKILIRSPRPSDNVLTHLVASQGEGQVWFKAGCFEVEVDSLAEAQAWADLVYGEETSCLPGKVTTLPSPTESSALRGFQVACHRVINPVSGFVISELS